MTSIRAFVISHDWGDPREPQSRNGLPVSFVSYSENGLNLHFKIFGTRVEDSSKIDWHLEAPSNTRAILGLRWQERWTIFQRVIDHLISLEPFERWQVASSDFSGIKVDVSKIMGIVPTVLSLIGKRWSGFQQVYLPSQYTALTLSIGFLSVFVNSLNYYPQISPNIFKSISFLFGVASIVQLVRSIQRDYEAIKLIALVQTLSNPKFNWRRLTIKILFTGRKWRYAITLTLALVLVFFALSISA